MIWIHICWVHLRICSQVCFGGNAPKFDFCWCFIKTNGMTWNIQRSINSSSIENKKSWCHIAYYIYIYIYIYIYYANSLFYSEERRKEKVTAGLSGSQWPKSGNGRSEWVWVSEKEWESKIGRGQRDRQCSSSSWLIAGIGLVIYG